MTVPPHPVDANAAPIRVLLVEDNPGDARLILEMLGEVDGDAFQLEQVDRLEPALERLGGAGVDVVVLDLGLPGSEGIETLERALPLARDEPIVVVSGLDDEALAVEAVRSGAQDYLVKGRIDGQLLARVLRYAIARKRTERALRNQEEQFRQLTETITEVYYLMDARFTEVIYVSPAYERVWGRSAQSLYEEPGSFLEPVLAEDRPPLLESIQRQQTGEHTEDEFRIRRPDGAVRWILARSHGVTDGHGNVVRIAGVALDITDRKEAEDGRRTTERRLHNLFETVNLLALVLDEEGTVEYVNPFLLELTGYTREEAVGSDWIERFLTDESRERMRTMFEELLKDEVNTHFRNSIVTKGGEERLISWHNTVLRDADGRPTGTMSVGEDVTAQTRLQAQLEQAQKMEAVGRLAGGIAHDFNNLLTVILGPVELLLVETDPDDPVRADLIDIRAAVQRAAALTRQLLAFSRRQVLEPKVLDLNALIGNLERMLRRIIGEDIELRTRLGDELGAVLADPGQVEQVVVNLAVNSRDAMPTGGTLTIETANVELNDEYAEEHVNVSSGPHVMLAVSDTGIGMDAETRSRVFEPFYTTKPVGKGTGLGLATVYGIVQQSNGHIWVYSEPGRGTTLKVYLPRVDQPPQPLIDAKAGPRALRGTETLLVVEDDAMVRRVTQRILESRGYRVLLASHAEEALEIAEGHEGDIPLLVTDVVMPDLSGMELATRLEEVRPGIRTIFVSGYTDDTIVHHGVLAADVHFVQKPFTPDGLAAKVRQVLDAEET